MARTVDGVKVIGFDPGVTTGVCIYNGGNRKGTGSLTSRGFVWEHRVLDTDPHHQDLWKLLTLERPGVVVCESFTYQRRDKVILTSLEYIGVIKLYCSMTKTPLKMQTPAQAKGFWDNTKLKHLDLWITSSPHAMDALRHVLTYLVKSGDQSWLRALKE